MESEDELVIDTDRKLFVVSHTHELKDAAGKWIVFTDYKAIGDHGITTMPNPRLRLTRHFRPISRGEARRWLVRMILPDEFRWDFEACLKIEDSEGELKLQEDVLRAISFTILGMEFRHVRRWMKGLGLLLLHHPDFVKMGRRMMTISRNGGLLDEFSMAI